MSNILKSTVLYNPITGIFGNGEVQYFFNDSDFSVPIGVSKVRVRLWGGGGADAGGGGGFALKEINVNSGDLIPITVGRGGHGNSADTRDGQTSSFGSFVSATGGKSWVTANSDNAGEGVGGDINNSGGYSATNTLYGSCGSLFGTGGGGTPTEELGRWKNTGFALSYGVLGEAHVGEQNQFSIDFIGTGGYTTGYNGGGSQSAQSSPAGGITGIGQAGCGLVIVEY